MSRVEHIGPVGSGHHDHIGALLEPVHFGQDLVQRLLALVMPAAEPGAAALPDRKSVV